MPKMKIATFNANSIRARLPIILDWLQKEKPDILAVQETKVTDLDFPKEPFLHAGWHVVYKGQKSYNGVAFVSKSPLTNVQTKLCPKSSEEEARFISAEFNHVLLVNTYVPQGYAVDSPKFQAKLKFFSDLQTFFSHSVKKNQPALWMGDLNVAPTEIDLWDPAGNAEHVCFHPKVRQAFDDTTKDMWVDLFREKQRGPGHYTFWDYLQRSNFEKNRGWRIDLILGTRPMAQQLSHVWIDKRPRQLEKPSDHTFLVAEFKK